MMRSLRFYPGFGVLFLAALMLLWENCARREVGVAPWVRVDGSSTVYPLSEAIVEEFLTRRPGIKVTLGVSGTGGGFKKFLRGETEVSDASRPMKRSELELAARQGLQFIELPVAYDAIAVVVNAENDWCYSVSVDELKRLWQPSAHGRLTNWNQLRLGWPESPIDLFGPGVDSGTFDFFTKEIVGGEGMSRGDFTSSEDDNVLVRGIAGDRNALGFFSLVYYRENSEQLRLLGIDDGNPANGAGAVLPDEEALQKGLYRPLTRPIFIYVRRDAAERPEVEEFVKYYINQSSRLARDFGYIPLSAQAYQIVNQRFERRIIGSAYESFEAQLASRVDQVLWRQGTP